MTMCMLAHFQHPNFGLAPGHYPNDFAVIQTHSVPSGPIISPATIASSANNPGGNGAITGWGETCKSCFVGMS